MQSLPGTAPAQTGRVRSGAAFSLLAVFALGLAARLYAMGGKPFWMDEVTTLDRSGLPLAGILHSSLQNHHLPAYFLLAAWMEQFGIGEWWLRLPSGLCGAASCCMVALIARRLGGARAGLLAGVLMALSPLQVQYGQEARSYALVTLLILVALLGVVGLALDPVRAALPLRQRGPARRDWVLVLVGTAGALSVLSVALMWWVAANLAAISIGWRLQGAARAGFRRNWLIVSGVSALCCLPWFVAMYLSVRGHDMTAGLNWVPAPDAKRIWAALAAVYLFRVSSLISGRLLPSSLPLIMPLLEVSLTLLALGGAAFLAWRRRPGFAPVTLAMLVLPLGLLALSSVQPMWMPRYILWSAAPFFILAGLGLRLLPRGGQAAAVCVLGLLAAFNLWPYYQAETKPRWDLAAAVLHEGMRDGDLVLVGDYWGTRLLNVYLKRTGDPLVGSRVTQQVTDAAPRIAQGGRVWVVFGRIGQAEDVLSPAFRQQLAVLGDPAVELQAGLDVKVLRYDPPQASLACSTDGC